MIAVIGAGAFGTALAAVLARGGREVRLWARDAAAADAMNSMRENARRLPDVILPAGVTATGALADLEGADAAVLALPAPETDAFLRQYGRMLLHAPLVLCAKGLTIGTLRLQTEIAAAVLPGHALASLTGPGFATEIGRGLPTALTLACADPGVGRELQQLLSTARLRLYLTEDILGAQLGGALKNVVAIACGMADGAGLGQSARAALMTRGFAEMVRLARARGARSQTLAGLSGLGDLALTCHSAQSRNFALGQAMGAGRLPKPGETVEGIATARAACELGRREGVDLPVAGAVTAVLAGEESIASAMEALLSRPLKEE